MSINFLSKSKAFSLYIWLILFVLIISTASIVIFNYVAADIKTASNFFKSINKGLLFDSYAIAAVELFKTNNERRSIILDTDYTYEITPIDSSNLLVNILKGSELYAKYIVQYSIELGSLNKIVGSDTTFKADNKYNNTLIASNTASIQDNANKIFNSLVILPNANITKESGEVIDQKEFIKYTNNLITDIDIPNLNQELNSCISNYYRNYYQGLYNKYYDGVNLKSGVSLYEDSNIVFTNEGDLIVKKQAKLKIYKIFLRKVTFDTYIDLTITDTNERYYLAISERLFIEGNNPFVFDYLTEKAMQTNDIILAENYQDRVHVCLYYNNGVAKVINLNDRYISVKTPNKQFIVISLDDLELESTTYINNNFIIVTKEDKNVSIKLPFRYIDYDVVNHAINNNSNSLVKVVSNNILIDANNSNNIDITGIFIAFYSSNSSINIINAPNDVRINVFGSFQTYGGVKINGRDISNTDASEFYYSDPRVDKLNDIVNLKLYRTQILAKEILKLPTR